ncbi:type II toxin-antitoxin system MqsR family toxin [Corallococcus sp. AB011P]|uniref:type II toxin-antitoxin system MqsR family toxin n=1 Tax=Corallococcus sp. AB011P TaxID=2316735 RepID=UPI0011C49AE7|nr:type II toxin-antitoxin system MqsR family toxin [Corallococcus sp. AB011P]
MRPPFYKLDHVKQLIGADRFAFGTGPACIGALEAYLFGELSNYRPFAQAVIGELRIDDFWQSRRWPEPSGELADEYGIRLSPALTKEFEVKISTWYVKITVRSNRKGESLFFMSLHPLAFEMSRNGGLLKPER